MIIKVRRAGVLRLRAVRVLQNCRRLGILAITVGVPKLTRYGEVVAALWYRKSRRITICSARRGSLLLR